MTVYDIYNFLDEIAPFKNQMQGDNSRITTGDPNAVVKKVLVCLDVTNAVAHEAVDKECNLIIAHHPLLYRQAKKIMSDDPLHALIRNNINLISIHTNLDVAPGGITDQMLVVLGLPKSEKVIAPINPDGTGFGKIAVLDKPLSAKELAEKCKSAFNCTSVRYIDGKKPITKIGVGSGNCSELVEPAIDAGCDAFICGDIKNDVMILAFNSSLTLIDAGHFHTEDIFCDDMVKRLKERFPWIDIEKAANSVDVCSYI